MPIEYQIIESASQFLELRDNWNTLLETGEITSPFLTWEWMYCWWIAYGEEDESISLCIVVSMVDGEIAAILPGYMKRHRRFGRALVTYMFLGSEYESSDYLEVIQKNRNDEELVCNLFLYLLKEKKVDSITLYNILEDCPILNALNVLSKRLQSPIEVKLHRICPYLPINGDWNNFVDGLSKNFRYNLRRRSRKLLVELQAKFSILSDYDQLDKAIDELFFLHEERFKSKKEHSIFVAEIRKDFHKKISSYFLKKNILRIFRLSVNDNTIATLYGYEYANRLFYFQFGMDPEWSKYSPGIVIMGQCLKYAFDKNLIYFDFMRGSEEYKFQWTDKVRNMVSIDIAITKKGKQIMALSKIVLRIKDIMKIIIPAKIWNYLRELNPYK